MRLCISEDDHCWAFTRWSGICTLLLVIKGITTNWFPPSGTFFLLHHVSHSIQGNMFDFFVIIKQFAWFLCCFFVFGASITNDMNDMFFFAGLVVGYLFLNPSTISLNQSLCFHFDQFELCNLRILATLVALASALKAEENFMMPLTSFFLNQERWSGGSNSW